MKKIILLIVLSFTLVLSACGNKSFWDTTYTFDHAYVKIDEKWQIVKIDKWTDYDGEQLQLELKSGITIVLNSNHVVLISGDVETFKTAFLSE